MGKPQTLELCRVHLFDDVDKMRENKLSQQAIDRISRLRAAFTLWNSYPLKKDAEIRDYIMRFSGVNKTAAYEDIQILKILLGDFAEAPKAYRRFQFNAMVEETYEMAKRRKDPKAMAAISATHGKYNQLDKEDAEKIPWAEIVVQPFEPTSDPTVIGIKPVANIREKIAAMKKKYMSDIAEDIDYEDVDFDEDKYFGQP